MNNRYNSITEILREKFGGRVYKVSLEADLGCPNRDSKRDRSGCAFCHPGALKPHTAIGRAPPAISDQILEGLEYLNKRHGSNSAIAYFQNGTNTYASASELARLFEEAIDNPSIVGLAVSTRPDCLEDEHVDLLKDISKRTMLWVELGLQSAHDETLVQINRGHTVSHFKNACKRLEAVKIPVCAHAILGLPGENISMMKETALFLNDMRIWGVKVHNLHVLKDTPLDNAYKNGDISLPTLEEYASWVVDFLEILSPEIVIHRFNSHSPRSITVAPKWSINKLATLNAVHDELERRNSWQGKRFQCPSR